MIGAMNIIPRDSISKTVINRLIIQSKYGDTIPMYKEKNGYVAIPRYTPGYTVNFLLQKDKNDKRVYHSQYKGLKFTGNLRDYQNNLIQDFVLELKNGKTGFLIDAPTGTGKTVMCLKMLEAVNQPTLVIVPLKYGIDQWKERVLQFTNLSENEIGIAQGNNLEYKKKKIVIGTIQSLWKGKFGNNFNNYFGCIVFDEVHKAGAEKFSQSMIRFPAKYRIGMSATLDRADGMEQIYKLNVGEVHLSLGDKNKKPLLQPVIYKKMQKFGVDSFYHVNDPVIRRAKIISDMIFNDKRNDFIARSIYNAYKKGRNILCLSDRVNHLKEIRKMLWKLEVKPALVTGSVPTSNRLKAFESSKIILATYGIFSVLVDVPRLDTLILASPVSDPRQTVGRILRTHGNKQFPVVLDIIDSDCSPCIKWWNSRARHYQSIGAKIK